MSNYLQWTKHPETGHWHNAYWIDNHFGHHHYGVKFNDGKIFSSRKERLETVAHVSELEDKDEIIDRTKDQYKEIFGESEQQEDNVAVETKAEEIDTDTNLFQELTDVLFENGASVTKQSIQALQIYILKRDVQVIKKFAQSLMKDTKNG